jgi:adenylate kinase family enzyme
MWLSFDDALPYRPARVLVTGTSGSGKSALAHHLAATLELPYVELDALHHGANWTPRPAFVKDVTRFAAEPRWTTEWQYPAVRELLAQGADLLILLDLSRPVVMTRVIRRTLPGVPTMIISPASSGASNGTRRFPSYGCGLLGRSRIGWPR